MHALLARPDQFRRLQIEVTTHCNLFCEECSRTVLGNQGKWVDEHMGLEPFKLVLKNSPPAEILILQGVGEPTLNPELVAITEYARDSGLFKMITLNTNAVTRGIEHFRELRAAGLTYVCVSVDSFHPEIAERCRAGTKVPKLKARLREIYQEFGSIVISMVASKMNMFDLPNTLFELDQIGEELFPQKQFIVEIQPVIDYKGQDSNRPRTTMNAAELENLRDLLVVASKSFPRLIVQLNTTPIEVPKTGENKCGRPFYSPFVTAKGYLTPCCTTFDPSHYQHTNVLMTPIADAWETPPVRGWLESYLKRGHEICDGCCFQVGSLRRRENTPAKIF
jgi:MoaA/NifB/PqqE/SkfB family radical SAM enzyme